nr:MAG TPA: hypothetical protein [Caudoviricetes sp.]
MQAGIEQNCEIEKKVLQEIAKITTAGFTKRVAATLESIKYTYGFEWYIDRLQNLRKIIAAGVPEECALEAVQNTAWSAEIIVKLWKGGTKVNERL